MKSFDIFMTLCCITHKYLLLPEPILRIATQLATYGPAQLSF